MPISRTAGTNLPRDNGLPVCAVIRALLLRFERKLQYIGWHLSADVMLDAIFIEHSSSGGKVLLLTAEEARDPEAILISRLSGLPGADMVDFFPSLRPKECCGDEGRIG